nr:phosphatase PAP2 family protein [Psychrobacter sp. UBA3962]
MKTDTSRQLRVIQSKPEVVPSPIFTFMSRNRVLAVYVNQFVSWDTSLCIHINRYSTNYVTATFFKVISRLGDGWFWYAMMLGAFIVKGWEAVVPVITVILVSCLGLVIYKILKVKTVRPRPYQVHQVIVLGERPLDVFSFPSGHTLQAVLFTATLGGYFPELMPIMLPFTLLVALSRMVLGLHYPTDVLIGAAIGYGLSLWAPNIHQLVQGSWPVL